MSGLPWNPPWAHLKWTPSPPLRIGLMEQGLVEPKYRYPHEQCSGTNWRDHLILNGSNYNNIYLHGVSPNDGTAEF